MPPCRQDRRPLHDLTWAAQGAAVSLSRQTVSPQSRGNGRLSNPKGDAHLPFSPASRHTPLPRFRFHCDRPDRTSPVPSRLKADSRGERRLVIPQKWKHSSGGVCNVRNTTTNRLPADTGAGCAHASAERSMTGDAERAPQQQTAAPGPATRDDLSFSEKKPASYTIATTPREECTTTR